MNQYEQGFMIFKEGVDLINQSRNDPSYSHLGRTFISFAVTMMREWMESASDEDKKLKEHDLQTYEKYDRDLTAFYKTDIDQQQSYVTHLPYLYQ